MPTMQLGLIEAVRHWSTYRPGDVALISNGRHTTYRDLLRRAEGVACALRKQVGGGRVAIVAQTKAAFVAMLLGTLRAGRPPVVLNPGLKSNALRAMIADTQPSLLIHDSDVAPCGFPEMVRCLRVDCLNATSLAGLPWPEYSTHSEWGVIFSSGSTGTPKGVERDHGSMVTETIQWCLELPLTRHSVFYISRPLFYTGGLVLLLATLFVGATAIANDYRDDDGDAAAVWTDYQSVLLAHDVDWAFFVPAQLRVFIAAQPTAPRHSKTILVMGAPISGSEKLAARNILGSQIVESWGNSESLGTITEPEDLDIRPDSIGRPFLTDELTVVDVDNNTLPTPCAPRQMGRLAGSDAAGFSSYSNRTEATVQVKRQNLIISDDVGYRDEDGYFFVEGRDQDVAIRAGTLLSCQRIGAKIRAQTDLGALVSDMAICIVEVQATVHVCAGVVLVAGAGLSAEGLRERFNRVLEPGERLSWVRVMASLPELPSGKSDRLGVRAALIEGRE